MFLTCQKFPHILHSVSHGVKFIRKNHKHLFCGKMSPLSKRVLAIIIVIAIVVVGAVTYYSFVLTKPPRKVELTLFTKAGLWADFVRGSGAIERFKERMLKEKNIEVEVKLLTAPHRGYSEKLVATLAAGTVPDVFWVSLVMIPDMVESGYVLDLTPYVEKWDEWGKFYKTIKDMIRCKGKIYAIPNDAAIIIIYYRKDIFKKAGLPVPWQPKTWEDVFEAARIIKEKVPDVKVPLSPYYGGEIQTPIFSAGGKIYDPTDGKFIVKSKEILFLFKVYYDAFYTYKVTPRELILERWDTRKLFQEGKLAILVDGTWCYSEKWGPGMAYEIPNREETVGYAYLPGSREAGAPKYVVTMRDYAWAIGAKSEHPELAFELIKELVKPEVMSSWGYKTSHLVARADAVIGDYAKDVFLKWNTEAMEKYGVAKPLALGIRKYLKVLQDTVKKELVTEGKTPEECMEAFAAAATAELGADKVKSKL